jgi:hypothetical protein
MSTSEEQKAAESRALNEYIFDQMARTEPPRFYWSYLLHWGTFWQWYRQRRAFFRQRKAMEKQIDAIDDFIRQRMRETPMLRKILPPVKITNEELDRGLKQEK